MDHVLYNMAIIIEQDATEYSLFKSVNRSTRFGWYLHPSSAHNTISTVSGANGTAKDKLKYYKCLLYHMLFKLNYFFKKNIGIGK